VLQRLMLRNVDFGMFVFTVGTTGLHNSFCIKIFNSINCFNRD